MKNPPPTNFLEQVPRVDLSRLNAYEVHVLNDMLSHGVTMDMALLILINNVEGDYSQLSPELLKLTKFL